ncbi:MAG TPA: DUF4384 domain-containing protein [Pyrinomonadaceae bacterium]|jgi:hypothetical protein
MRLRTLPAVAALALLACAGAAHAQGQQKDEQKDERVIEEFTATRGVSFDGPDEKTQKKPAPPRRKGATGKSPSAPPPSGAAQGKGAAGKGAAAAGKSNKTTSRPGAGGAGGTAAQGGAQASGGAGAQTLKAGAMAPGALALGYTILLKDGAGRLSPVDGAHEFKTGDSIAVALESNADGYLYMFNASDGKNPELLFPNAQLDGGANWLMAHARATFPADLSYDFSFTDPPAKEHLFVVLAREPLAEVPTGAALVEFCGSNVEDCAWKPSASLWERIRAGARARGVTEARAGAQPAQAAPQPLTPQTLQRGLKVKREDPRPAVVRVNNSPADDLLVTEIVLVHK